MGHQGAADGDLLALAARQFARRLTAFVAQDREQGIDLLHRRLDVVAAQECAHFKVLLDRHRGEYVLGLRHKGHAFGDAGLWGQAGDILAINPHRPGFQVQHAEHRFHRGGFSRTIGADDDRDLTLFHGHGAGVQDAGARAIAAGHHLADQKGVSHARGLRVGDKNFRRKILGKNLSKIFGRGAASCCLCLVLQSGAQISLDHRVILHDVLGRPLRQHAALRHDDDRIT